MRRHGSAALCLLLSLLLAAPACVPDVDPEAPEGPDVPVLPEPEPEPEPDKTLEISIIGAYTDLYPGEKATLGYALSGTAFDPAADYKVSYESSNPSVATVNQSGAVTAISPGSTVIKVTETGSGQSASRIVYVVNLSLLKQAYQSSLIFTSGHTLYYKSVMQSWDFFDDWLYACQISGNIHSLSFTRKPVQAQSPQVYMHLKYYGHGDNMFVERASDGDWLWTPNYGTLETGQTNRYVDSQVLSRVRFREGITLLPDAADKNFVIPGMKRIVAAYDPDNGTIGIWCRDSGNKAWFYVYDLETVKKAQEEPIQLSYSISYGSPVVTERPTVNAVNLDKVPSVCKFKMPLNNVPQGYDWHHGKIWFLRGDGAEADEVAAGTNKNWARAYLISTEGKTLVQVDVPWVDNLSLLASEGITNLGYFEAEGIKVKDGVLYLGFASKDAGSSPPRRVNIFKYPLD